MSGLHFFVVARVVGSPGAFSKWKERLIALCEVSMTEDHSVSYYWGQDLDGEPDTLWGLEGYSHAVGFFLGHPASETFKQEMAKVDSDKLLKHVQGLGSPDYDLHYYDQVGGWLTKSEDADKHSKKSHVSVLHLWTREAERETLKAALRALADQTKTETAHENIQSCLVLKECRDREMVTLWIRARSKNDFEAYQSSELYQKVFGTLKDAIVRSELHQSQAFNGHIEKVPKNKA